MHVEGRRRRVGVGVGVWVVVVWGSHHQIELSSNSQFNLMKRNEIGEFVKKKMIDRDWDCDECRERSEKDQDWNSNRL